MILLCSNRYIEATVSALKHCSGDKCTCVRVYMYDSYISQDEVVEAKGGYDDDKADARCGDDDGEERGEAEVCDAHRPHEHHRQLYVHVVLVFTKTV